MPNGSHMDDHRIYDLTVVHMFKCILNLGPRAVDMLQDRATFTGTEYSRKFSKEKDWRNTNLLPKCQLQSLWLKKHHKKTYLALQHSESSSTDPKAPWATNTPNLDHSSSAVSLRDLKETGSNELRHDNKSRSSDMLILNCVFCRLQRSHCSLRLSRTKTIEVC